MNDYPNPKENPKPESSVSQEIPSVVGASQSKNTVMISAFLLFMAIVAVVVLRKPSPKDVSAIPVSQSLPGPSLPQPMIYPRPDFPVEAIMSRPRYSGTGDSELQDVRRKSPILIFNKTGPSSNGPSANGLGNEMSRPGLFTPNQAGESSANANSGAPMPSGYLPTSEANAQATQLGNRQEMITQGKLLDAVLETAINSDHPGMLRALISHDVYADSGRLVLLPRGTRLVGEYDSAVAKGQNRVFVIWQRAIRPDGVDIQLGSAGTDTLGRTGIEGNVNNHFFTMFGAATLLSIIGATASVLAVNPADQNNSLAQYRESVTNGFSNAAGTVLGQFVQIKPTITVRQGVEIKVFVARDLYFDQALSMNNHVQYIQ